jgi:hypothetical protein
MSVIGGHEWAAVVAVLLGSAALSAQPPRSAIVTHPDPPTREALDRLNLTMAWRGFVPMDGMRDGFASVQFVGYDLLIETRSGLIVLMDAETGATRWRTRVGQAYRVAGAPAANTRTVLLVNNTYLYALDRATGQVQWQYRIVGGVSAPLAADDERVWVPNATGRLTEFYLPRMETFAAQQAAQAAAGNPLVSEVYGSNRRSTPGPSWFTQSVHYPEEEVGKGPVPFKVWDAATGLRLEVKPLVGHQMVMAIGAEGAAVGYQKVPKEEGGFFESYRFEADGPITVGGGQFGDVAYLGSQDANVYAVNINTGRALWRFTAGEPVVRRPAVLEEDIYISSLGNGLSRIDRDSGEPLWRIRRGPRIQDSNPEADRFLAANAKLVYAFDRSGRLLVLDRRLGHRLSVFDVRDFVFPISNDISDRLYLAANNGLIVCLHDKDYPKAIRHHRLEEAVLEGVKRKLAELVTDPGDPKITTLREMVDKLTQRFGLKISIADRAFTDAGLEMVGPKLVRFPKVDNKPLGEVLQMILAPIGARFDIVEDTILIVPGAAPPPEKKP